MTARITVFAVSAVLLLAGCATTDSQQVAARDCKIYPLDTKTLRSGPRRDVPDIDQKDATGRLATSDLRWRMLNTPLGNTGLIEEALRDCQ